MMTQSFQMGLQNVLLLVPVFLFSLCFHEFAHAWVASRCGDNTARNAGRLTMAPMAHADLIGTLILPIVCVFNGWPFFGWAKPVPVDVRNLKRGRFDMALVALAGPMSNFLLAVIATFGFAALKHVPSSEITHQILPAFASQAIVVNLMLGFFNLIPIPPLDGFAIAHGFSPKPVARLLEVMFRYSGILLLLLLLSGFLFPIVSYPTHYALGLLRDLANAL